MLKPTKQISPLVAVLVPRIPAPHGLEPNLFCVHQLTWRLIYHEVVTGKEMGGMRGKLSIRQPGHPFFCKKVFPDPSPKTLRHC